MLPLSTRPVLVYTVGPLRFVDYRRATCHPLPCLFFLLPLLAAYEVGIWCVPAGDLVRNGADHWLRRALEACGLPELYWAPALVGLFFLAWSWLRRDDLPDDLPGVCVGMAIESLAFGLGLWVLSRSTGTLAHWLLTVPGPDDRAFLQIVTYVGAGIYEELLFRLLLYSGLLLLLRLLFSRWLTVPLAALLSALLFAAAHHAGPYGEPFNEHVFVFRALAGVYFALLYQLRGFGIAVGAHVCYDVLVGVRL